MTWKRSGLVTAITALLLVQPANAGKVERGFEALGIHDYFKARELFLSSTKKQPAAAWYGLSVITGRQDNPFYQLDSSWAAIQRSRFAYSALPEKGKGKLAKLGVDSITISAQEAHVHVLAWQLAEEADDVAAYTRFGNLYPGSVQWPEAIQRRDKLAFQVARAANTAAAYRDFIATYPQAEELFEARSRMEEAVFREGTPHGTLEEYEAFIIAHPESPYVHEAEDRQLEVMTPHDAPAEYAAFIQRYPASPNVPQAWRTIYGIYTKELTVANV
ncbi:MAG: hypothetical protein KBF49_06410, partial [Flavobacteriales bacterium]|nr:hypothetical protein [Flavobacteriales bacterium]